MSLFTVFRCMCDMEDKLVYWQSETPIFYLPKFVKPVYRR